jgi:hypothetical protein
MSIPARIAVQNLMHSGQLKRQMHLLNVRTATAKRLDEKCPRSLPIVAAKSLQGVNPIHAVAVAAADAMVVHVVAAAINFDFTHTFIE